MLGREILHIEHRDMFEAELKILVCNAGSSSS